MEKGLEEEEVEVLRFTFKSTDNAFLILVELGLKKKNDFNDLVCKKIKFGLVLQGDKKLSLQHDVTTI